LYCFIWLLLQMKKQEWDVMKLMISMSKTVIVFVYATLSDELKVLIDNL